MLSVRFSTQHSRISLLSFRRKHQVIGAKVRIPLANCYRVVPEKFLYAAKILIYRKGISRQPYSGICTRSIKSDLIPRGTFFSNADKWRQPVPRLTS